MIETEESSDENKLEKKLLHFLSPASFSTEELVSNCDVFLTENYSFDNKAIFDTHTIREEILYNVDNVLEKYTQNWPDQSQIERDLLWAALQLTVRIHALHEQVGLVVDANDAPMAMTELQQRMAQLTCCQGLLTAHSEIADKIKALQKKFGNIVVLADDVTREKSFAYLINEIDTRNKLRLFGVWVRSTLDLVFDYAKASDAARLLNEASYLPGQISWSLYILRLSLFCSQYLQSRKTPAWIEKLPEQDQAAYLAKYHSACLDTYKYRMLNDVFWGPINLACFGWWIGTGFYGWLGDAATVFLLGMDTYLAELKKDEIVKKHQMIDLQYTIELTAIRKKHYSNTAVGLSSDNEKLEQLIIEAQQDFKRRADRQAQELDYDRYYAWLLLLAFIVSVAFLTPGYFPLAITAGLKASGTILCMAFTVLERSLKAQAEIAYHERLMADLKIQADNYRQQFGHESATIDMKWKYEKQLISYQYWLLLRNTLLRIVVPTLLGLTLVYAPASLGIIPTYVVVLALSALLAYALERAIAIKKPDKSRFFKQDHPQSDHLTVSNGYVHNAENRV